VKLINLINPSDRLLLFIGGFTFTRGYNFSWCTSSAKYDSRHWCIGQVCCWWSARTESDLEICWITN